MIISHSRDRANAAGRQSVDDSAGTAGSDAGLTSPDEALVGRAPMDRGTPNERCQGEGLFALGRRRAPIRLCSGQAVTRPTSSRTRMSATIIGHFSPEV